MAHRIFTGVTDVGYISDGTTGFGYAAADSSEWKFAWALHAGVAYNVTNNFKMELAYRYLNMGDVNTSTSSAARRAAARRPWWPDALTTPCRTSDLARHQARHALDAHSSEQQQQPMYVPPLMRKG